MRNRPPFTCPSCGDGALAGAACLRCRVAVVDQQGAADLSPAVVTGGALRFSLPARWLSARARARDAASAVARAGPVVPIARAPAHARIRGRARIVHPVKDPFGESVGAYRARKSLGAGGRELVRSPDVGFGVELPGLSFGVVRPGAYERKHVHYGSITEESSACGRFYVEDDSGTALVDDDAFDVWVLPTAPSPTRRAFCIGVQEGAEIEVIGPGKRRPAEERELRATPDYRRAAEIFCFDGSASERVLILASVIR